MKRWIDSYIDEEGWISAGGANRTAWFVSSLPNEGASYPLVQDWVRGEHATELPARSFLWRIEAECSTGRQRILESFQYENNNLRGIFVEGGDALGKWIDVPSGSVMESVVQTICRGARP